MGEERRGEARNGKWEVGVDQWCKVTKYIYSSTMFCYVYFNGQFSVMLFLLTTADLRGKYCTFSQL